MNQSALLYSLSAACDIPRSNNDCGADYYFLGINTGISRVTGTRCNATTRT